MEALHAGAQGGRNKIVLSSQFSVFSSQFSVLSPQFSEPVAKPKKLTMDN
jgi:hypothetical protein